jgi:ABC-type nitrate/sulfonate/bicarbonate transport system substrate-binding protein
VFLVASPLQAADKVRLSISALDVSFLTAGVASKRGFFKDEGLDVEVIRMNANVSIPALSTGDIDYTMVFASVIRGALRGLPIKVVASFMDSSTHMLIARPEHKAVKDLKGKILGVSTFGATADVAARMMIRHSGIDPEREIKIIALARIGLASSGSRKALSMLLLFPRPQIPKRRSWVLTCWPGPMSFLLSRSLASAAPRKSSARNRTR